MTTMVRRYLRAATRACGRGALARLQLATLTEAAFEALVLVLLVPVIAVVAGADEVALPVVGTDVSAATAIGLLLVAVLLRGATQWWAALLGSDVRLATADDLRMRALDAVLGARWTYLARQRRSDIVHATTVETERTEAAVELLMRVGVDAVLIVGSAAVAIVIAPAIGGLAVVGLALVALVGARSVRRSVDLGIEWTRRAALFGGTVTDSLASLRLIRAHEAADAWQGLLTAAARDARRTQRRYVEITTGVRTVVGFAVIGGTLGLMLLGRAAGLGVAELVALAAVAIRLLGLARNALTNAQAFAHYASGLAAVEGIIDEATRDRETAEAAAPAPPAPAVRPDAPLLALRDLTAGYGEEPSVRDVSLEVRTGELVVVVGETGAGKSTLLDVVLGLLPPTAGAIEVDGAPVADLRAWRGRIGYVPQQTVLFPGSVRENLSWSAGRKLDDAAVWAALETACVADVVRALPQGLDTHLTDQVPLSGGEQQRLALARALVRAPDLLVLDEATSALDAATEQRVLARLAETGAAVLMASHRETVAAAAARLLTLRRRGTAQHR